MVDMIGIWAALAAFVVVAAAPGPATLALATVAMRTGRGPGLRFGLGLSAGLAFWGLVAAAGLGALLQSSAQALTMLKLLGGAYLLWLAVGAARSAWKEAYGGAAQTGRSAWFRQGLLLNLSNPKAVLAWMATLSLGLDAQGGVAQVIIVTSLCSGAGCAIYAVYGLAFSVGGVRAGYQRARRWIDAAAAGLFALAGFGLIRSALSRG